MYYLTRVSIKCLMRLVCSVVSDQSVQKVPDEVSLYIVYCLTSVHKVQDEVRL